ncbi:hypothetical protein BT96DRAFT_978624 [Gymnopus androsaceus JB14]|uniref:Protein kinase domain-containing protein n=1 Tax=Gymnopus androsaceus JB14 TaxID=1447944 RepID=A0A6A4H842_9AGAR|nr:hypothetical protein BT96DRAFT_978624 [Gymnopus androsaceus JB14]
MSPPDRYIETNRFLDLRSFKVENKKSTEKPITLELNMGISTASKTLQKGLGTDTSGFCLNPPIPRGTSTAIVERLGGRFSYDWKEWTLGKLQTVIDFDPDPDDNIQLVALLISEFRRLPPREWSSELPGGNFFSLRTSKEPSSTVKNSKKRGYPAIVLGTRNHVRTINPSDNALKYAQKMSDELCVFFANELRREEAFRKLLGDFLGVVIDKENIGDYTTDGAVVYQIVGNDGACRLIIEVKPERCGTGDPGFQVALYYLENSRIVRRHAAAGNSQAADCMRLRLPSFSITHAGPSIQILGGVMIDRPQTEVLTASMPMSFHTSNKDMFLDLARTLTALHILFTDLGKMYENAPEASPSSPVQHSFPYPRSFEDGKETTSFTYIRRVDPSRLVFEIKTEHNDILYVKYTQQYGEAAHRKAQEIGLAPKLLACTELEGGWKMVVMESIPTCYEAVDDIFKKADAVVKEAIKRKVREALDPFFVEGYVHGDLRPANIFFDVKEKKVLLIDYDWAGPVGKVRYPPSVWTTATIWRPEAHLSLRLISLEHDREMVEHLNPLTRFLNSRPEAKVYSDNDSVNNKLGKSAAINSTFYTRAGGNATFNFSISRCAPGATMMSDTTPERKKHTPRRSVVTNGTIERNAAQEPPDQLDVPGRTLRLTSKDGGSEGKQWNEVREDKHPTFDTISQKRKKRNLSVALTAEWLVDSISSLNSTDISQEFVTFIILPIVDNAEHFIEAIFSYQEDKLTLSLGTTAGSSIGVFSYCFCGGNKLVFSLATRSFSHSSRFIVTLAWIIGKLLTLLFDLHESIALFLVGGFYKLSELSASFYRELPRATWQIELDAWHDPHVLLSHSLYHILAQTLRFS